MLHIPMEGTCVQDTHNLMLCYEYHIIMATIMAHKGSLFFFVTILENKLHYTLKCWLLIRLDSTQTCAVIEKTKRCCKRPV